MRLPTVLKIVNVYTSISSLRLYQTSHKMQNVYIRCHEGAEQFEVSFRLKNELLGVDREFNLCRKLTETVDEFLARVTTNVEKRLSKKKKKKKETEGESKIEVSLLRGETLVPGDRTCKDVLFDDGLLLQILDSKLPIILNAPWVSTIALPSSIMAGFPAYPIKLEVLFAEKSKCNIHWFKSSGIYTAKHTAEVSNWTEVGCGYCYTPSASDIGSNLKIVCSPKHGDIIGPPSEIVSTSPVEAGPGTCPFDTRHIFTEKRLEGQKFRVVTYNILADLYADSEVARKELFPYCPPYALNIDYRKQLILKELLGYNADIICLQEVDSKVFDIDLLPTLSSIGFNGIFNKKAGTVSEGLACFFNESRFKLVASHSIHLGEELKTNPLFSELWTKVKDNDALVSRITERTTCSQYVVLDSMDSQNERIVVANTHQYFHPDADHIRLLQSGMTISFLENLIAELTAENKDKNVSCIICGDFNSTPEWGVYRLMTEQFVPDDLIDWSSNKEEAVKGVSLSHSLRLSSACGTPEFTNYTVGFSGCLDYIFYQQERFDVVQVVPLPSTEELQEHTALPSVVFPSDHIALVADLSWKAVDS